jgi:glutathione S-transferase
MKLDEREEPSMPILHGAHASPFVRKVRVVLAHKSLEYEHDPVVPFGVSDEYKKKSPLGKIPCWEDGDLVLPDSSVICSYLESVHPTPALYPSEPGQRARALWYEEHADTRVVDACATVFFQRFVRPTFFKQDPDEALIEKALTEKLPVVLDYLTEELGDRDFLVGDEMTIADIATASPFVNMELGGETPDASRWPAAAEYVKRVLSQPSFKPIYEADVGRG